MGQHVGTHPLSPPIQRRARSAAKLCCLVRYTLLAAAHEHYNFSGTSIPKDFGFTCVLIDYCKRKWDDDRFQTFKHTHILPSESDLRKGVVRLNIPKTEDVEQFSISESEDDSPGVRPEG
jgi:hypothetical protein